MKSHLKEKDWVIICKKCGDELGIVYEPKEPQYLYVYNKGSLNNFDFYCSLNELTGMDARTHQFIGKIKLKDE